MVLNYFFFNILNKQTAFICVNSFLRIHIINNIIISILSTDYLDIYKMLTT